MIRRSTLILVGVFLALVLVAVLLQRQTDSGAGLPTPAPTQAFLFGFTSDQVTGLTISDAAGRSLTLTKDAGGAWTVADPPGQVADQNQVLTLTTMLASLRVLSTFDTPLDAIVAGLDAPAFTITVTSAAGTTDVLAVGVVSPTGSGYYVRLNGSPPVLVERYSLESLTGALDRPPVAPTAAPTPAQTAAAPGTDQPPVEGTPAPAAAP